jgi:hypothetical protein
MNAFRSRDFGIGLAALALVASLNGRPSEAHKLISSKYTYNDDIFPILRDRCGRCHVPGGVAPMSLMDYKSTYPWAESLKAELVTGHMPPWNLDEGSGAFRNSVTLTAAEVDKILTWASGGTPEGNPLNPPPDMVVKRDWPLGPPDLSIAMPSAHVLSSEQSDATVDFTLPTDTKTDRWLRAVDVLPGTPAIVRSASVWLKAANDASAPVALSPTRLLAAWLPGQQPIVPSLGGFLLPAGSGLILRIHYKKTYKYDGKEIADRSTVGLYFSNQPAETIASISVGAVSGAGSNGPVATSRYTLPEDLTALAFCPDPSLSNARLRISVIDPDGTETSIASLSVRPDWTRRYWFAEPLRLRRGSQIKLEADVDADELLPPAASPIPKQARTATVAASFDVVRHAALDGAVAR